MFQVNDVRAHKRQLASGNTSSPPRALEDELWGVQLSSGSHLAFTETALLKSKRWASEMAQQVMFASKTQGPAYLLNTDRFDKDQHLRGSPGLHVTAIKV